MVEHFGLEIDGENAFNQRERDVDTAVAPSELHKVLNTEDSTILSVLCFLDGIVEVGIEGVNEALSGSGGCSVQSFPEPRNEASSATRTSDSWLSLAYSRASLAKDEPLSQEGSFRAFMNESDIPKVPFFPSSSLQSPKMKV